ncbi:MAG: ATP-binding protein [Pseudomonadota bacterium]
MNDVGGKTMGTVSKALLRPTTLYVLALLLLAFAAIGSHLVLVSSLAELEQDSLVINKSGRQRMLSEQTFRLAGELVAGGTSENKAALRKKLQRSLSRMRENHKELSATVRQSSVTSGWDAKLFAAYFDETSGLDDRLTDYFASLDAILGASPPALTPQLGAYRAVVSAHRHGLLNDLDQTVQIYEDAAEDRLEASERLHVNLMLGMLALLLLEALFIFRPLIRRLASANRQLKAARDDAQSELAARSNILAAVSHEIRTPLGGVLGIIDQLKRERSQVEREHAISLVEDSCEALLETLDAILRQARLGQSDEGLADKVFSPRAVAQRVAELFRPVARRKALIIEVNATSDRNARGDGARIQQVLANLVSNAVKFTQTGSITIFVQEPTRAEREWAFVVADTGSGMDEKRAQNLFQPFGHSSDDSLGRDVGAGLGLSITRDLINAMGGRIEVESELGRGTSFTVLIPLGEVADDAQQPDTAAARGDVALLIDRASDRVQAEAVAVQLGYTVHDLSNAPAADIPTGEGLTVIADAALVSELDVEMINLCGQVIILGDGQRESVDIAGEQTVIVSHSQLVRSLGEILKGGVS